jgi:carboxypeptidase Q
VSTVWSTVFPRSGTLHRSGFVWPDNTERLLRGTAFLIEESTGDGHVVLFANEEFGLSGARTYADNRADRIDEHFMGLGADLGGDRVWRFDTWVSETSLPVARAMFRVIEPLGVEWGDNDGYGIPDFIPLKRLGMPVLDPVQDATRYFDFHHTVDDTLDKVDPAQLRQNVAIYAALTWMLANVEADFRPAPGNGNDD